ncbi:MAG: hypothetical protein KJI71_03220 [Patescibacteria group bacterium]|nr:hypothetical protein [Patescibacteria group bacterium]
MNNFLTKLKFLFKKQKVVIVTGQGRETAKAAILEVLRQYFKVGEDILVFESKDKDIKKVEFFLKRSRKSILVVTRAGDIPYDKYFFDGDEDKIRNTVDLARILPSSTNLILNFDDETIRSIDDATNLNTLTFGFQEQSDFRATDIKLNGGTNFKLNYEGKIVPIWLGRVFGKEQIYSALSAIAVGNIFGLNLVEISQSLKDYHSLPGKMRLVQGIKNSQILDDSESATVSSMIEALEVLGNLQEYKRKIAALGDVVGIGKYTIEAHEAIGEKVFENADLLFTFGARANFIAKGARSKGMLLEKIFHFDTIEEGKIEIQKIIKEGDVVLVDGSKEMKMQEIVEEIESKTS